MSRIYNVIYRPKESKYPLDVEVFQCEAETVEHAEEQAEDAYPDCEILWIDQERDPQESIKNWYSVSLEINTMIGYSE
jgi:hypothetical protein